jgi:chemotaxis protein CheX
MDTSCIPPIMKSIGNVFSTMLNLKVELGKAALTPESNSSHDVSAIIGFSGDYRGSLVLGFPTEVAGRVVALFVGAQIDPENDDFADAIGELANMVAGNAKAGFDGKKISISCPSVVMGPAHKVRQSRDMPVVQIPASCECGEFVVEVSLKAEEVSEGSSSLAKSA